MVKADLHNHIRTGSKIGSYLGKAMTKTRETLGENGVIGIINFGDLRYESFLENGKGRLDISSDGSYFYDKIEKVWGVKGQEVETDFGHLLILGVPSKIEIESRRSLDYILSSVRDFEGIIIADHPFYYQGCRRKLDLRIHEIDGFEVHNGEACFGLPFNFSPLNSKSNRLAIEHYQKLSNYGLTENFGAISSSDGHSIFEIGSSWTELDFNPSEEKFKENLAVAIRKTNLDSVMQKTNSYSGAIKHIGCLVRDRLRDKIKGN